MNIHVHGRKIFLTEQSDGYSRIYHNTDIHDTTRICGKIQSQVKSAKWVHLRTRN